MLLRMASPIRRDGSSVHYLRKRVPADLTDKAVGVVLRVPVGDETAEVQVGRSGTIKVSLRTHDPREAKVRQAKALAYLDDVWRSMREAPRRLTHREVIALAGEAYRHSKKTWESDPGRATLWNMLHQAALKWDPATAQREMAPYVAELLQRKALRIDDDSSARLAAALHEAFKDATALLERWGRGDYGPDLVEARFPEWKPIAPLRDVPLTVGIIALWTDWAKEARLANRTEKTIEEYGSLLRRFVDFLGHDDAASLTPEDFIRWKDRRLADGLSLKTVKDTDMSVFKSVFGWATENRRLTENPVPKLKLKLGKTIQERPKGFVLREALAILKASSSYVAAPRELPQTAMAKRWVPWLCAYTGSRVGEMVQLRREDVEQRGPYVVVTITPEAGPVKNKQTRRVVLHEHLVECGFLEIVKAAPEGYLFVAASDREKARGRIRAVKNRLCEFARSIVADERVSPNHGWRHRFQTVGGEVDASERVVNAICGHGRRDVSDDYGDRTFKAMATALAKYPRYDITQRVTEADDLAA
ncbi:DUF6538 domain-containing protein [Bradyrhizobium sp. 1(2017)]|uniref:DUF6538 domain-containing protein n=1 Tax=Bradyrhizobium sp. 1(2017) TaxID=1404888 RepID=UPI00140F2723|nr:DUF6538 domain-containing protein [Bradyrhizobium sp. 1(2017)]QIO30759.1 tyrosine-type recombinase/integrase [Bradyrhizobium sp. 1(2017)]